MERTSKVLHLTNLSPQTQEEDLEALAGRFGSVTTCVVMPPKEQGLIEMSDLQSAHGLLSYLNSTQHSLHDRVIAAKYSTHQQLDRSKARPRQDKPNRILLATIHHCVYPMTVDIIHQIFSPHGSIEKIVVFLKTEVQALVQFATVEAAAIALTELQGQYIYQDVCRLRIVFSRMTELTVKRNDELTRDFLNPHLDADTGNNPALLPSPGGPNHNHTHTPHSHPLVSRPVAALTAPLVFPPAPNYLPGYFPQSAAILPQRSNVGTSSSPVLLVSNLNGEEVTCDILFNLFSSYGAVVRIKIFYNKRDHALVQMADVQQAALAMHHLKTAVVFGKAIHISPSKHTNIRSAEGDVDASGNPLNVSYAQRRTRSRPNANYFPPSSALYLSNLPEGVTEEVVREKLATVGAATNVKLFELHGRQICIAEFDGVATAMTVLCKLNNSDLNGKVLRMAFSRSRTPRS